MTLRRARHYLLLRASPECVACANKADPYPSTGPHGDRHGGARSAYQDARGETASVQTRTLSHSAEYLPDGTVIADLINANRIAMLRWARGC